MEDSVSAKLKLNPTAVVETRRLSMEPWRTVGKRRRAIRPPLAVGEMNTPVAPTGSAPSRTAHYTRSIRYPLDA